MDADRARSRAPNRLDRVILAGKFGPVLAPRFLARRGARRRLALPAGVAAGEPRISAPALEDRTRRWRRIAEEARLGGLGMDIVAFVGLGPVGIYAGMLTLNMILDPSAAPDRFKPLLVSLGIVAVSAWLLASRRAAGRALTCWETCRCADCRYDLTGLDEGDARGPELCPECGAPWPMVPPYISNDGPLRTRAGVDR